MPREGRSAGAVQCRRQNLACEAEGVRVSPSLDDARGMHEECPYVRACMYVLHVRRRACDDAAGEETDCPVPGTSTRVADSQWRGTATQVRVRLARMTKAGTGRGV